MPNWCANDLTIHCDNREVLNSIETLITDDNGEMTFTKLIPEPEALQDIHSGFITIDGIRYNEWRQVDGENVGVTAEEKAELLRKYGATNLYHWHCNNYGTKWDACHSDVLSNDGYSLKVSFATAWSPPIPVINKLIELYPDATIALEYFECGCAFQGGIRSTGDGEIHEWSGDYYGERGG